MTTIVDAERRLAVVTNWALVGSIGLCLILSGFQSEYYITSLCGFAALIIGFIAHIIINQIYRTGFMKGEIVVGFVALGVGMLCFVAGWMFDSNFGKPNVLAGLVGLGGILAVFLTYVITKFGLKSSFSMFHTTHTINSTSEGQG